MGLRHAFTLILVLNTAFAITCNFFRHRKDGMERSLDTCVGDYCYTYTAIFEIGYDQGCVSGLILPTQCWTDRSGTLCVCNDDMSNAANNRDAGELQSRIQCLSDFTLYGTGYGTASIPYSNYDPAYGSATCDVHGTVRYLGTPDQTGEFCRGEPPRESGSFRILIGSHGYEFKKSPLWGKERGQFTLFYYGGFYVSNYGGYGIRCFGRCRTDNCNTWSLESVKALMTGVRCKASNLAYPIENTHQLDSCEGQMCVIMTSFVKHENTTYQSQFCFSQNSEAAEYPIMVDHYSNMNVIDFAIQNYYLCAEDDCNVDVFTAQYSIDRYKETHNDKYPPTRNPLFALGNNSVSSSEE